jgi:lysophospholipase L1-like esterase
VTKRAPGAFKRVKGDFYRTWDPRTVAPLIPHLEPDTIFAEPCAGDGILAHLLQLAGVPMLFASDLEPKSREVAQADAFGLQFRDVLQWVREEDDRLGRPLTPVRRRLRFITNPPWNRAQLHALIPHLARIAPTWLLFDADWAHTEQAAGRRAVNGEKRDLLALCHKIVSVGRVKWFEGSRHDGLDNAAWFLFDAHHPRPTEGPVFINGRTD